MKTVRILFVAFCLELLNILHAQVPQLIDFQGRVAVDGVNFNGTGEFKFALVNGDGSATFWSNDGTSVGGSEPSNAVASLDRTRNDRLGRIRAQSLQHTPLEFRRAIQPRHGQLDQHGRSLRAGGSRTARGRVDRKRNDRLGRHRKQRTAGQRWAL